MVSAPDAEALDVAATTKDHLQQLAPHLPDKVRAVERSDSDLDADLAAWAAGTRPHLSSSVQSRRAPVPPAKPTAVAKRKAFYTELLAFLALPLKASRLTRSSTRSAPTPPR